MILTVLIMALITGAIWWVARLGAKNTVGWWLRDFFFKLSFYISILSAMAMYRFEFPARLLMSATTTLIFCTIIAVPATIIYYYRVVKKQHHLQEQIKTIAAPRLNTKLKRAAFLIMCIGVFFVLAGIFQISSGTSRVASCFVKQVLLDGCGYYTSFYYSPVIGTALTFLGLFFSYLYDSTIARVINWIQGSPE